MNAVCETRVHIVEIVADIDDAIFRKSGRGNAPGQDFALVAAAFSPKAVGGDVIPQACMFQAKLCGAAEICRGFS